MTHGMRIDLTTFHPQQQRSWAYLIQHQKAVFIDQLPTGITRWLVPDGDHNLVAEYDSRTRTIVGVLDEAWARFFQGARRREAARQRKIRGLVEEYLDGAIRDGRQHGATAALRQRVEDALQHYAEAVRMEGWRERRFGGEE